MYRKALPGETNLQAKLREPTRLSKSRLVHLCFSRNTVIFVILVTFVISNFSLLKGVSNVMQRNFKVVKGPPFLVFAKGMPSKMETCKRISNDLPLSNLRPTDRESSKNDDVGHTYSHTCNYPFRSIS